ncbi:MAG: hypothetical protein KGY70_14495 [Bacteroidales bacterium]|nr:hypothetical protein [Bacteroidales bacterium]
MSEEAEEREEEAPQSDPKTEERARMTGWAPKEEFKGDPEKWVPAEEWNRRTDEIMPILKSTNQKLESELGTTKKELQSLRDTMKKVVDMHQKVSEREYNRALETIRKQQKTAVEEGDGDTWEKLEKQKDQLEKPSQIDLPENQETENDFQTTQKEWFSKNTWCSPENPELYGYAQYVANNLAANDGGPKPEHLAEIEKQVKEKFPDKFSNKRRETSSVDTGDVPPEKAGKKKSYNNLPKEAKDACDKFVKQGLMTKDQYVEEFFADEE